MLREALRDKNFVEKLIRLTIPIALQSLLVASVAAADAFMLGRLDQNSMAAVSLASQVQFVMTMFLAAVTGTGSILGAQYFGKQDFESLDDIYHMSLRLAAVIDILFFIACLKNPKYFFCGL
jgi:Na+-driven multidrug efflux pump